VIFAILRATFLELIRDRAALLLTFALPGVYFVIFAQIFATSASGNMVVDTVIVDEVRSEPSAAIVAALAANPQLMVVPLAQAEAAVAEGLVRRGDADAGVVLRSRPMDGALEIVVLVDPARGAAGAMLRAQLMATLVAAQPRPPSRDAVRVIEHSVFEAARGVPEVAYAAGAVSFMFLLFASAAGAMSLMEERESGVIDRVLAGPGGIDVLVCGKFLYLLGQGIVQVGLIFVVAWLAFDVALTAHLGEWLLVTACAATAAAGLAMLLVTATATRRQAQTLSTVVILVLSAIGGSMVPRYVMPPLFKSLGWLTPNTWALEAYAGVFWRQAGVLEVLPFCLALLGSGLAALALAVLLARRTVVL
jgi:ABC-2 type transport system permease protein